MFELKEGLPFVQGNAEFGTIYPTPRFQCLNPPKRAHSGDILLSVRAPVGALNIADRSYGIGRGLCALTPAGCDGKFLWWWIHSQRPTLDSVSTGTTYRAVTAQDVGALLFPAITLGEQRRIADFLDVETSRIDALDSARHRQLELLREREQAMFDALFCNLRSGVSTRLKRLFKVRPRYGVLVPEFVEEGVPFIRVNDLLDLDRRAASLRKIPATLSAQYARTVVQPGDLLVSVVGTLGRSVIAPDILKGANIARAVCSVRVGQGVEVDIVQAWLRTTAFRNQALVATSTDTAQPTLGMEDFGNFCLTWPSDYAERQDLQGRIRSTQQTLLALKNRLEKQRAVLAERRQAVITAAVTGKIDLSTAAGRGIED